MFRLELCPEVHRSLSQTASAINLSLARKRCLRSRRRPSLAGQGYAQRAASPKTKASPALRNCAAVLRPLPLCYGHVNVVSDRIEYSAAAELNRIVSEYNEWPFSKLIVIMKPSKVFDSLRLDSFCHYLSCCEEVFAKRSTRNKEAAWPRTQRPLRGVKIFAVRKSMLGSPKRSPIPLRKLARRTALLLFQFDA